MWFGLHWSFCRAGHCFVDQHALCADSATFPASSASLNILPFIYGVNLTQFFRKKKKIIARISRDLLRIVKALLSMFFSVYFLALILSGTYGNQHPWWISQETEVCTEAQCHESFFRWFHTRRLLTQEGMEWGWSVSLQQCSLLQDRAFNRGQKPAQVVSRGCCLAGSVGISSLSEGRW